MTARRTLCVAVGVVLCAACAADHWDGGGRRQELPVDDRMVEASGASASGLAGEVVDTSAGAGAAATGSEAGSGGNPGSASAGSANASGGASGGSAGAGI